MNLSTTSADVNKLGFMSCHAKIQLLRAHKLHLANTFDVLKLEVFGSVARDTATDQSDLDLLIAFEGPATSARFFGVKFYLEDLMGCTIDLVTDKALRAELRPIIQREAVTV